MLLIASPSDSCCSFSYWIAHFHHHQLLLLLFVAIMWQNRQAKVLSFLSGPLSSSVNFSSSCSSSHAVHFHPNSPWGWDDRRWEEHDRKFQKVLECNYIVRLPRSVFSVKTSREDQKTHFERIELRPLEKLHWRLWHCHVFFLYKGKDWRFQSSTWILKYCRSQEKISQ